MKESRDENARRGWDPLGFVLVTLGVSSFVFGLVEGRLYSWLAPTKPFTAFGWTWPSTEISIIPVAIVGGLLAVVAFAWVELGRQRAGRFPTASSRRCEARGYRHGSPLRATRGSRIQRVRLLWRDAQIARLEAKPCSCPRPTTTKEKK